MLHAPKLCLACGLFLWLFAGSAAHAQENLATPGPLTADLGTVAKIEVPAGYSFIGKDKIRRFNELTQNLTSPNEVGVILPDTDAAWYIMFAYSDEGYIKDDDKDKLDAAALLKTMQENEQTANLERKRLGLPELTLIGWEKPPFYDPRTNNLTWALKNRSAGQNGIGINYQSRILGRGGYMSAILVCSADQLAQSVPAYDKLLAGFSYKEGQKYSEWRAGDKVAAYGLGGLVLGGAGVAAAKSGLLGKLLKPIIIGVMAVGGAIAAFFRRIFGRGESTPTTGE